MDRGMEQHCLGPCRGAELLHRTPNVGLDRLGVALELAGDPDREHPTTEHLQRGALTLREHYSDADLVLPSRQLREMLHSITVASAPPILRAQCVMPTPGRAADWSAPADACGAGAASARA